MKTLEYLFILLTLDVSAADLSGLVLHLECETAEKKTEQQIQLKIRKIIIKIF